MLETNREVELAQNFLQNTAANIFLTGKAGTGKSTFLLNVVKNINKRLIVAAPTGVAALNVRGVTLHSIFQLPFTPFIPSDDTFSGGKSSREDFSRRRISKNKLTIIKTLELLIIDEISMVRCDLLDAVDETLRTIRADERPFGGVQLLMVGDVQQLSPVCREDSWQLLSKYYSSPYFFESKALKKCSYRTIELKTIYRQSDRAFTDILNGVGLGKITSDMIEALNKRYIPNFQPLPSDGYITLTTHNSRANSINEQNLMKLTTSEQLYEAKVSGDFSEGSYPNDPSLVLKVGAQVIFLKNDTSPEKLFYNGMIGEIVELNSDAATVCPRNGGENIVVKPMSWENIEYIVDIESGEIKENVKGEFTQLPLKCAWAITIHKSQGLSFDRAIIDAESSFAHGQVYVALSRLRSLEGLVLSTPLSFGSIVRDNSIEQFTTNFRDHIVGEDDLLRCKREYYIGCLSEIFSFGWIEQNVYKLSRYIDSHLYKEHYALCDKLQEHKIKIDDELFKVGENFKKQLKRLVEESSDAYESDQFIAERLAKGGCYFKDKISPLIAIIEEISKVNPDAKDVNKRVGKYCGELLEAFKLKMVAISLCCEGFNIADYQRGKMEVLTPQKDKIKSVNSSQKAKKKLLISEDIVNKELYEELFDWRDVRSKEQDRPHYTILSNRAIIEIQALLPPSLTELREINGFGKVKIEKYGDEILELVRGYAAENEIDIEKYYIEALETCKKVDDSIKLNDKIVSQSNKEDDSVKMSRKNEAKEVKTKDIPTHIVTLSLYYDGNDIPTIAKMRGLGVNTIYNHIAKNIEAGELSVSDFVAEEKIEKIKDEILNSEGGLKELKALLGDNYTYDEIKLVISSCK